MTNYEWTPITAHELALYVAEGMEEMEENDRERFLEMEIPFPFHKLMRCQSSQYGDESIFAVAKCGNKFLIFDDAEEEFGIVESSDGERFSGIHLVGTLGWAFSAFRRECEKPVSRRT